MSDGDAELPAETEGGRRFGLFGHLRGFGPVWKVFIGIGEVAASIAVIAGAIHFIGGDPPKADPTSSSNQTSVAPQLPSAMPASSSPTSVAGAKCWTSAKVVVDCQETHRYEEIPQVPSCDQGVVTGFLGGVATVDVLVARPASMPGSSCVLDAGHELRGSAKDALQSESGAVWRRCSDRAAGKNVPCSTVHTGEYVATGNSSRATDPVCLVAAATYLDQLPGNLVEDLTVRAINVKSGHPDPARCIVEARGNHRLTDSVRNLGSRPVPVLTN